MSAATRPCSIICLECPHNSLANHWNIKTALGLQELNSFWHDIQSGNDRIARDQPLKLKPFHAIQQTRGTQQVVVAWKAEIENPSCFSLDKVCRIVHKTWSSKAKNSRPQYTTFNVSLENLQLNSEGQLEQGSIRIQLVSAAETAERVSRIQQQEEQKHSQAKEKRKRESDKPRIELLRGALDELSSEDLEMLQGAIDRLTSEERETLLTNLLFNKHFKR